MGGQTVKIDATIDPAKFLPENRTFYNYEGSLTTPPLLESVIWTVFKEHITMSEEQVKAMRCMKITCEDEDSDSDGGDMVDNYRPPCPVGGRVVRVSKKKGVILHRSLEKGPFSKESCFKLQASRWRTYF